MIANLTSRPAKALLRIDARRLGIGPNVRLTDELQDTPLPAPLEAVPVEVLPRDYAVLSLAW